MEVVAEQGLPVVEETPEIRERIDARESGFPHPSEIPVGTPGPQGTPLLEITLPADILESPTAEPDVTETISPESSTQGPDVHGTPGGFGSLAFVSHGTGGQTNQANPIEDVGYDQKLNNQLPMDTVLFDEGGHLVKIGDFFNEKPIVLVFAYYECPMLCTLVLNELTRAMRSIDLDIGNQFEVITVSIDPQETYELAVAKKETYLNQYNRPGAEKGWHFLTGRTAAIQDLTNAVGFRYFYDEELDQFAHPAGILILTPDGRIARYLSALDLPAKDLRLGLVEASAERIGTAVDQFFLLCYAYDPVFGRYNLVIENVLLISSLLTILLLGSMISLFIWKERRKGSHHLGPMQ
jgi:protein SCO1/2